MGNDEQEAVAAGDSQHQPSQPPKEVEASNSNGSQSDTGGKHDVIIEAEKVVEEAKKEDTEDKGGFGPYIVCLQPPTTPRLALTP
jgi:hypothetical protein